ncbi:respiratory-chain NADH dehydrogenase [Suillus paluster]|uniref:respiratory-chain NADH dehydrogenase n=1 Tax=Suillus paluster TaxID=48578 RepID=UPI001B8615BB|nr:respiratory-chain NADH dehydrogenase [Suillus paluster]KAG1740764.1 respiratory-chain NADH dehydrogenase [Suillus paluster]
MQLMLSRCRHKQMSCSIHIQPQPSPLTRRCRRETYDKIVLPRHALMNENTEALIHHFKLFNQGRSMPPETYSSIEAPKGEISVYLVSDATNRPYRCKIRAPGFTLLTGSEFMTRHIISTNSCTLWFHSSCRLSLFSRILFGHINLVTSTADKTLMY